MSTDIWQQLMDQPGVIDEAFEGTGYQIICVVIGGKNTIAIKPTKGDPGEWFATDKTPIFSSAAYANQALVAVGYENVKQLFDRQIPSTDKD